jgi:hypothetical protein
MGFFSRLFRGLSDARLWGLATGGALARFNEEPFDQLESIYDEDACREVLAESWNSNNRSDVLYTLDRLLRDGHTTECLDILRDPDSEIYTACADPAGRIAFAHDHRDQFLKHGLVAWDCGRIVSVVRWAYSGGYLREDEAWEWIADAGRRIQRTYKSWAHYGDHWALGHLYWNCGRPVEPGFTEALNWLNRSDESPWRKLAWDTELS